VIVGIDLGTTHSLIGAFTDGAPRLIPNVHGHLLTPSAVAVAEDGTVLVGVAARELLRTAPDSVATQFKRWMGTDRTVTLRGRTFRAEELSAFVLRALKADAETALGCAVKEAVITVPAYFNDAQRQATRVAGELAGLHVSRLLSEPTAAGLAYGLTERPSDATYLVFDLGGGTFDVSVLECFEGVVQVRASAGDSRLGGEDVNQHILQWCEAKLPGRAASAVSPGRHGATTWRAIEQAKRELSERSETSLTIELSGQLHTLTLTRSDLEAAIAPWLERLRRPVERALSDSGLSPSELSEVVLVGGATRMPAVQRLVARLFQRLPLRSVNPDEVVALGAAVQAALKAKDSAVSELVLTDVMPFSLGVISSERVGGKLVSDRFSPIIERNMPVPISRESTYCTVHDGQTAIELDIRQGESPIGSENLGLGTIEVPVPPRPAGQAEVHVRFTYDPNGLLAVDVREPTSGRVQAAVIERQKGAMSEADKAVALARMAELKVHPREQAENTYLVARAKRLYEERLGEVREQLLHALSAFELVLDAQDPRRIPEARARFRAFLDDIDGSFVL
jgi:molecular chaperone HscC